MGILTPKNIPFDDYYDRAKYLMAWRITIVLTFVTASMSLTFYNIEFYALISYLIGLGVCLSGLIYLLIFKSYRYLILFYAILGTALAHFSCNMSITTTHYVDFLWMIICTLLAFIALGNRYGLIFVFINATGIAYFVFFTNNLHIKALKPLSNIQLLGVYVELLLVLFIIAYLLYQFVRFQEYSKKSLEIANMELEGQYELVNKKNDENLTLLKEIHHRVKNNLQIIISLLRLQQSEMKSAESQAHFTEAINRVMIMSSIHQKLYQQKDLTDIDLENYVTELAVELKELYMSELNVVIDVDCDYKRIDLKTIVPVGLLLNELLSNSFKYAFDKNDSGNIRIDIRDKGKNFEIDYADNGNWKPDVENTGFGMELIHILTDQLNGQRELKVNENGTSYYFTLQKLNT